jgi:prepilin-type N-terminal cleavage/methylation domain-containing protein
MSGPRDNPHGGRKGFSLIEMVLVVVLVALVAAIARPRYVNSLNAYRANMAAKRIAADLILARKNAWATGVSKVVTFTLNTSQYQLVGLKSLDKSTADYVVNLAGSPYCATLFSISFGGTTSVTFDGYGFPTQGGTVVVQAGSFQKTVVVDQASGSVSVQ